jgi:hypothetical protein
VFALAEQDEHSVFSVNPLTLLWLTSQNHKDSNSENSSFLSGPGGSLYFGSAKGNSETLYGFSLYSDFFDISIQQRNYLSKTNSGLFAGSFLSAEVLSFQYFIDPDKGITITNNKKQGNNYFLLGLRYGGNIGMRFGFSGFGISPRIGLTLPIFYLFGSTNLSADDSAKLYFMNAMMRAIEIGLTIDFGVY